MQEDNDKVIEDILTKIVIESSSSPWAAGIVLVKKKDDSTNYPLYAQENLKYFHEGLI